MLGNGAMISKGKVVPVSSLDSKAAKLLSSDSKAAKLLSSDPKKSKASSDSKKSKASSDSKAAKLLSSDSKKSKASSDSKAAKLLSSDSKAAKLDKMIKMVLNNGIPLPETIKKVIEQPTSINDIINEETALNLAVKMIRSDKKAIVEILLRLGADPNIKNKNGKPIIYDLLDSTTSDSDILPIFKLLLKFGTNPNIKDQDGIPLLNYLIESYDNKYSELIIKYGADPNLVDECGFYPLINALSNNRIPIFKLLLEKGADPNNIINLNKCNDEDEEDTCCLIMADHINYLEEIKLLFKYGANPNVKVVQYAYQYNFAAFQRTNITYKTTPFIIILLISIERSQIMFKHNMKESSEYYMIELYLRNGANPNSEDYYKNTPLILVSENGLIDLVKLFSFGYNTFMNHQNNVGDTALIVACRNKQIEVTKFLIQHKKIDITLENKKKESAFSIACDINDTYVLELLLIKDKSIINTHKAINIFLSAVKNGQTEIVLIFLKFGINQNIKDKNGMTAFELAIDNNKFSIIYILLKNPKTKLDYSERTINYFLQLRSIHSYLKKLYLSNYKEHDPTEYAKLDLNIDFTKMMDENTAKLTINKYFKSRVDSIIKWHIDTMRYTQHLITDERKKTIRSFFSSGLVLFGNLINKYGFVFHLGQTDLKLVLDAMRIVNESVPVPLNLTLYRAVTIINTMPGYDTLPPKVGTQFPHPLPFATSMRDSFALSWRGAGDCCIFAINVPKGTNAYFWGPPPFNIKKSRMNMSKSVFDKMGNYYEVLLPPHVLEVVEIYYKKEKDFDFKDIDGYFNNHLNSEKIITIYKCKLIPINLKLLVGDNNDVISDILSIPNRNIASKYILYAPDYLKKEGKDKLSTKELDKVNKVDKTKATFLSRITQALKPKTPEKAETVEKPNNFTIIDINKTIVAQSRNSIFSKKENTCIINSEKSNLDELEEYFVTKFLADEKFGFKDMCDKNKIVGISLIPFTDNQLFVGKENDGIYNGLYNFFGGKTNDKYWGKVSAKDIASVMFQETYEEMGIILDASQLINSMNGIILVPLPNNPRSFSMLIIFDIIHFDNDIWKSIMVSRINCEHKYYEMTDVISINTSNLKGIKESTRLSKYVKTAIEPIVKYRKANMATTTYPMDFYKLHTVRINEVGKPIRVSPIFVGGDLQQTIQ